MDKSQKSKLQSEYQKLCNKDPDYRNRVSFKEYSAINDPQRLSRIDDSKKLEGRWNNARVAPSVWEKMDKDPVYDKHLKSRVCVEDKDGELLYVDMSLSNRQSMKGARGPRR